MKFSKFIPAIFVSVLAFGSAAAAQDVDDCLLQISYYQEYYKQGTKAAKHEALPSWRKAYSICQPGTKSMRQNLYINGADLYRMLIVENANNPEYREQLFDTLVTLHKLRAEHYPAYADKAYAALAKDVNNYCKKNPKKTYELMNDIMNKQREKSDPATFLGVLNAAISLYKSGELSADNVINDYEKTSAFFAALMKVDTTATARNLRTTFENSFINSKIASSENLVELFTPRFKATPDDVELCERIVRLLANAEGGSDTDLFMEAATRMHALRPSGNTAYYLFRLNGTKKNKEDAIRYGEEAINAKDINEDDRAKFCYDLAVYAVKAGYYAKAVDAAKKAMAIDNGTYGGKGNFVIGQAWMNVGCAGNEVESRAKFWVAADYLSKARNADPLLADEAGKLIGQCAGYFPATAEAFMYDLQDGQSYSVYCGGLSATTTVRTK